MSYDLYNSIAPHAKGSDTSLAAAVDITDQAAALEQKIIAAVEKAPSGLTCDETEVLLGMKHQTASARFREAVQHGMLERSGIKRKTRSGKQAGVYIRTTRTIPLPSAKSKSVKAGSKVKKLTKADAEGAAFVLRAARTECQKKGEPFSEGAANALAWIEYRFGIDAPT